MVRIGLISDTHSYLDPKVLSYFEHCDQIWHAGDIGNHEVLDALKKFKPVVAVYGNIDSPDLRFDCPEFQKFEVEGLKVMMTHIAGKVGSYTPAIRQKLLQNLPDVLVCGHSHIAKVERDKRFSPMLYINPGAAGVHGFHKVRTLMRMNIEAGKIAKLEVIELGIRG